MLTGLLLRNKGKTKTLITLLIVSSLLLVTGILILVK
jgi:hypothetical protein